jgi:hypothetical protein
MRTAARAPSWLELAENFAQSGNHLCRRLDPVRRSHQNVERTEALLLEAKGLADAAFDPIALDCARCVLARDHHSEPCRTGFAPRRIEGEPVEAAPRTVSQQCFELGFLPQPARGIQPEALAGRDYSPRRRRPRARRLRSTLRPPTVRLRTRKPWRRARRVFEGW